MFCPWARYVHFTLTVLLSTQEYKWVVANYRFTVKSPESHVARSHVARNLSHAARNFSYVARKKNEVARISEFQTVNRQ